MMLMSRLPRSHSTARLGRSGFTMIELLVYMVIAGVVMTAIYQLLIGQGRLYNKQRELMDVHESLRSAGALLAWELRQAAAADGDLYSIANTSIALRSIQGTGSVCTRHATLPRFGLWGTTGDFETTSVDSILVYVPPRRVWAVAKLAQVAATPSDLGLGPCAWTGAPAAELGVRVVIGPTAQDTTLAAGVAPGAPLRSFRRVEYGLYQENGRWWLGRKVGGAASYELLTGPLKATDGLTFEYYDAAGNATADPTKVRMVKIVLRGESYGKARGGSSTIDFQRDSLVTSVALRG
jgi:prepilin-type N-terminal cleavage/methylation domain-containing protein